MSSSNLVFRRAFTSLALLLAAIAGTACSGPSEGNGAGDGAPAPARGDDAAKAPPVTGTPDASEITEAFGVFVAPNGRADNDGTHERPLASIQAGIDLGKRSAKRVYVCAGTFREALMLADSISIIGSLDCGAGRWRYGSARTRVEAPSSPAVRAKGIASATRLEGLDIVAPNAAQPSASSIGLLADHAPGVVIALSTITAGDGARGVDGAEGIQLVQQGSPRGAATVAEAECIAGVTCTKGLVVLGGGIDWLKPAGGAGGTSVCAGAPGHDGQPGSAGGSGGSGGLLVSVQSGPTYLWHYYRESQAFAPEYGQYLNGAVGAAGTSGTPSAALGALSEAGYVTANGGAGTDGAQGNGGFGGRGSIATTDANTVRFDAVWRGAGGAGGGAGGCPGLAGAAGTGGGASLALALIDSPLVVDGTQLISGRAGAAGRGSFGSDPTSGGAAGANTVDDPVVAARDGGRGGLAGISTNGSNGPSVAVLHSGAAPTIRGGTTLTPGPVSPAIEARSRTALGNTRTIPATAAGTSRDLLAL